MRNRIVIASLALALATIPANAYWSSDPLINVAVAEGSGDQVIPLLATDQNGGTYVAWFDNSAGSYQVRLQYLDGAGVERWPHNGILVSAHPQDTALFGWDMIADSTGGAVIVFSDTRDGGDLDIHAYRIAPDGTFPWGADGVTLSNNSDFEPAPKVVEASDGDFVFVWGRDPSSGDGDIRMQRLSPAGALRFALGPKQVVVALNEDPGFVIMVPADNGSVILAWLRNIRSFSSPRHLRARKFDTTGTGLWAGPVEVYNAFSLPIGYFPEIRADGAGGAVLAWHRSDGSLYQSFVQRLDTNGNQLFPVGGVAVSTTGSQHHIGPSPAYDPKSGATIVVWNPRNSLQSQWGIQAQRISSGGTREWGGGAGIELRPVDAAFKSLPRAVPLEGGAIAIFTDQPGSSDRLVAMRIDGEGNKLWGNDPVVISSADSGKARYPAAIDSNGMTRVVWEDDRHKTVDVYAQNLRSNGALGLATPGTIGPTLHVGKSSTTAGDIVLDWQPSCSSSASDYAVYEGSLGAFANRVALTCTDAGADRVEELTPGSGDRYYLVVPLGPVAEGSHGTNSQGAERAFPAVACRPVQGLGACGD